MNTIKEGVRCLWGCQKDGAIWIGRSDRVLEPRSTSFLCLELCYVLVERGRKEEGRRKKEEEKKEDGGSAGQPTKLSLVSRKKNLDLSFSLSLSLPLSLSAFPGSAAQSRSE